MLPNPHPPDQYPNRGGGSVGGEGGVFNYSHANKWNIKNRFQGIHNISIMTAKTKQMLLKFLYTYQAV